LRRVYGPAGARLPPSAWKSGVYDAGRGYDTSPRNGAVGRRKVPIGELVDDLPPGSAHGIIRTAKTDQRTAVTTNYGYHNICELLSATQSGTTTESYTYDPVGNRLSLLGVANYTNNTSNELTSTSNATYTYDYNGNTLPRSWARTLQVMLGTMRTA